MRVSRELRLTPRDPLEWEEGVSAAVEALSAGELLIHPTSTSYGVGGAANRALDDEINRVKRRASTHKLIRLAGSAETLRRELPEVEWDARAERLAAEFWPGPLTLILRDGTETGVAVRVDSHPILLVVLGRWRALMSSTSLNVSGGQPASDPGAVRAALEELEDSTLPVTFLSAGSLAPSGSSTMLSLLEQQPRVLRAGPVDRRRISRCLEIDL